MDLRKIIHAFVEGLHVLIGIGHAYPITFIPTSVEYSVMPYVMPLLVWIYLTGYGAALCKSLEAACERISQFFQAVKRIFKIARMMKALMKRRIRETVRKHWDR